MKTRLFTFILLFFIVFSANAMGTADSGNRQNEVVIYTYDSFISEWGPAPVLSKLFEESTGLSCTFVNVGDGAQILAKVALEKDAPQADLILGIDNNQINLARKTNVLEPYKPVNAEKNISQDLLLTNDWLVTPFDWSYFAIIYDSESNITIPSSLEDLTNPIYKNKIILMDPRTSTPGLGFVAWTVAVFGDDYLDYWKKLKNNILTMAPSWSTGYGLFTSGEAPFVISYTTSPAYHVEYNEGNRFKAIIFEQGHTRQIEGAALVKNAQNPEGAKQFLDFLVSLQAQEKIPLTQWMYPVNNSVKLPESYAVAPLATKTLSVDNDKLEQAVDAVMSLLAN